MIGSAFRPQIKESARSGSRYSSKMSVSRLHSRFLVVVTVPIVVEAEINMGEKQRFAISLQLVRKPDGQSHRLS